MHNQDEQLFCLSNNQLYSKRLSISQCADLIRIVLTSRFILSFLSSGASYSKQRSYHPVVILLVFDSLERCPQLSPGTRPRRDWPLVLRGRGPHRVFVGLASACVDASRTNADKTTVQPSKISTKKIQMDINENVSVVKWIHI